MAVFHPSDMPPGAPSSERKVWQAFGSLDSEWHVFHSVAWQAPRAGRQGDGEADFVLLHPQHGLVVVEVKGGRVEVEDGRWSTIDRMGIKHSIKDPFRQATDSKHALVRYLRDVRDLGDVPPVTHAVAFPDVILESGIGMQPRQVVIDSRDLGACREAVKRIVDHWSTPRAHLTVSAIRSIVGLLAPTLRVSGVLRSGIETAERQILTLTQQQIATMAMLRSVRRCIVRGGAGTGKSLLATATARRLAAEGGKVLLICFNAPLASQLAASMHGAPAVTVSTFHGLCMRLGRQTGQQIPAEPDEGWFTSEAANVLVNAADRCSGSDKFDCLVVDEAQDLSDDWLMSLLLLLRQPDAGPVTLFLDNHQQIYRTSLNLPDWPVAELDRNCRNTLPIARTLAGCFADPIPLEGVEGPEPAFVESEESLVADEAQEVVRRLLVEEGLLPENVVVLTNVRAISARLRTRMVGSVTFVDLGREHGVVAETIHRFKGLEAPVVVLALGGAPDRRDDSRDRMLMYVGLSRARSALFIVAAKKWIQWCKALAAR